MSRPRLALTALAAALSMTLACGKDNAPTAPTAAGAGKDATAGADGSTLKATAPTPTSPINNAALTDAPTLTASVASLKFGGSTTGPLAYRFQVFGEAGNLLQDSGLVGTPGFKVTASLEFKKRQTWRVRAEADGQVGPWSVVASFIAPEGGYIRGNEVLDPLYNGATVGERIGQTTFVENQGIRIENSTSYVRYAIPQTIQTGEFSMEVQGLRPNNVGDKSKLFAMSSNGPDFITDPYRVDIQYRGVNGAPPNSITYRVLYGNGDDLDYRFEPDTATRFASVYNLNPSLVYYWKLAWGAAGTEVRVTVKEGGISGKTIYDVGVKAKKGVYNPVPHYAYLGAPSGRSGTEAASIPGAIYRNVWISTRPRP